MKVSNSLWAEKLSGKLPEHLAREIDIFETEATLRKQGKLDERLFAETRLRRGIYGQRYDNGQRHDGRKIQEIAYPSGDLTKGPHTMWDAPGMQRIKIPGGGLNAKQLERLAGTQSVTSPLAPMRASARMKYSMSLLILRPYPNFYWGIRTARISAENSSRPSAVARNTPAALRACTTWA